MNHVDIVVPIQRGVEGARRCIESVLATPQKTPFDLVVVSEALADAGLAEWLRELADRNLGAAVIVARDRMRTDGHHEPMLKRADGRYVPLRWELANKHDR